MSISDAMNAPMWIIWLLFLLFAALSAMLLSGHGSWFIPGYNVATKQEREKYNRKKLFRAYGIGMSVIALVLLIIGLFCDVLPEESICIFTAIILIDCVILGIATETVCRN